MKPLPFCLLASLALSSSPALAESSGELYTCALALHKNFHLPRANGTVQIDRARKLVYVVATQDRNVAVKGADIFLLSASSTHRFRIDSIPVRSGLAGRFDSSEFFLPDYPGTKDDALAAKPHFSYYRGSFLNWPVLEVISQGEIEKKRLPHDRFFKAVSPIKPAGADEKIILRSIEEAYGFSWASADQRKKVEQECGAVYAKHAPKEVARPARKEEPEEKEDSSGKTTDAL